MSLFYQLVFPQDTPELEPLVKQLANEWGPTVTVVRERDNELVVFKDGQILLAITILSESDYIELSFGEYHYQSNWYIVLGKEDSMESKRFYLELTSKLVTSFPHDFLSLFNGERVVLKKEGGQLYLNTESGVWKKPESLAVLGGQEYTFVSYPVSY